MPNDLAEKARLKLREFIPKCDQALQTFWEKFFLDKELINSFEDEDLKKFFQFFLEHAREHNLRPAKRARAAFFYHGFKLFNPDPKFNDELLRTSIFIELIHTALLMHDDFEDNDTLRRGQPTTHKYFELDHLRRKARGDSKHFGASECINLGDTLLYLGLQPLINSNFNPVSKIKALNYLSKGLVRTGIGQGYDCLLETYITASEKQILTLHEAKTGTYTYETPLIVGGILADANDSDITILRKYSIPGGIAFQLQDDIIGMFGDTEETGKSSFSDLKEGKQTLLIIKALELAEPKDKNFILNVWGNQDITGDEAEEVRKIIIKTGSLEYSYKKAGEFATKSLETTKTMEELGWDRDAIHYLAGIAEYMAVKRKY